MSAPPIRMRPGSRRDQARDHPERGGLAAAGGAEQADELSLADGESEAIHGGPGAAVVEAEVLDRDMGRGLGGGLGPGLGTRGSGRRRMLRHRCAHWPATILRFQSCVQAAATVASQAQSKGSILSIRLATVLASAAGATSALGFTGA